jgi:chromatin licensing and DNA replication factor 1
LKSRINRLDDKVSRVIVEAKLDNQVEVKASPSNEEVKPEKKKRLNRAELKQKMEQFNQKLVAIQALEPEVVTKPVEAPAQLPAYVAMKDLADDKLDMTSTLTLPQKYARLLEFFKGSDSIEKMLFNRDEICTFLKLKMGIQNITKHTFTIQHLAQIKSVYPEAYNYRQEKLFIDFKNDYHLIISPNLEGLNSFVSLKFSYLLNSKYFSI